MRHVTRLALVLVLLGITALFQVERVHSKPLAKSSCQVTRNCDYGPPYSVSCTSANGVCQSGPDNFGWVQCDSNPRTYCPPDPCAQNGVCNPACPSDPDCEQCAYPDCTSFDGVSCPTGKKTMCSYGPPCRNFTCNCFGGSWICP
jgi:hypothetical protein